VDKLEIPWPNLRRNPRTTLKRIRARIRERIRRNIGERWRLRLNSHPTNPKFRFRRISSLVQYLLLINVLLAFNNVFVRHLIGSSYSRFEKARFDASPQWWQQAVLLQFRWSDSILRAQNLRHTDKLISAPRRSLTYRLLHCSILFLLFYARKFPFLFSRNFRPGFNLFTFFSSFLIQVTIIHSFIQLSSFCALVCLSLHILYRLKLIRTL
jgi:hypothetical protein